MLLTISRFTKGSFLGSLINKCRPVVAANLSLNAPTYTNKTIEEKAGLPPKPKRPLTPFFRYMIEQRSKLHAANPELPLFDLVRQISKQWQTADNSLKQRLQEEFKKDQQKYVEARTKYDAKLTNEQRDHLKELKKEVSEAKEKRLMRKRVKALGRPKKPASAFLLFLKKERTSTPRKPNETFREWVQRTSAKWNSTPEEEKDVYMMEARKNLDIYRKEMSLWEEKMMRSGNIDVVRHSNLIDPLEASSKKTT